MHKCLACGMQLSEPHYKYPGGIYHKVCPCPKCGKELNSIFQPQIDCEESADAEIVAERTACRFCLWEGSMSDFNQIIP